MIKMSEIPYNIEEIELAGNLQKYLMHSKDVKIEQSLKNTIVNFNSNILISVTKKFHPFLEIISVKIVNEDFIKKSFTSVKFNNIE